MSVRRVGSSPHLGEIVELALPSGVCARIVARGGCVTSLVVPDRNGRLADVVLSYGDDADYVTNPVFFGTLIGRYGNRIARGELPLGGQLYPLPINNGPNHLHGGPSGFHTALWRVGSMQGGAEPSLVLAHTSPEGDAGYPGKLDVEVTYTLTAEPALRVEYRARASRLTVVNLTQHAYFNLGGAVAPAASIENHRLRIAASHFLPTDAGAIPTGELRPVDRTPFDFRTEHAIGERIGVADEQLRFGNGYDHCFVIDGWDKTLRIIAEASHVDSGRRMLVRTTEPGVQLYSGNYLAGTRGKAGVPYQTRAGFCLETQHFPDSPHRPEFPSTELAPGSEYLQITEYAFPAP